MRNMRYPFFDRGSRGYYKPFATRTLVLASLLLITLTLIALTEYACRSLPNHAGIGAMGNVINGTLKRDLPANVPRSPLQNVERLGTYTPILSYYPLSLYSITSTSNSSSSVTTLTATGGYLSLGSGSSSKGGSPTPTIVHGRWLSPGNGSTTDPPPPSTTSSQPTAGESPHAPHGGWLAPADGSTTDSSPPSTPPSQTATPKMPNGGWLSPGDGSTTDPPPPSTPPSQPTTLDYPHGGWLSPGDGSTTDPPLPSTPPSQPTTVNSPASNPASQPTRPPVAGGNNPPADPNVPANPVQQPSVGATPDSGDPTGTAPHTDATEVIAGAASTPIGATEAITGDTALAGSSADHVTDSDAAPTRVVVVSNGQTFVETPSRAPVRPDASPTPVVVVSNGQTFTESPNLPATAPNANPTPAVFTSDGKMFTSTPSPNNKVENPSATPIIVVSNGHTFTERPTDTGPASTTSNQQAIKPIATVVNSTGTFLIWPGGESSVYPQITVTQYVLVSFLPLLIAVLYTIPFRILERTIRELEPFYQLFQGDGALAEHSLCLDYATSNGLIMPFKAVARGHGYMFWSSLMSLAVVGLAPLSSEALFVSLSGAEGVAYGADVDVHVQNYASWGIYPALARLIEGLLAFVAVVIVFMIWAGLRRESGVYGEPLSIAGLATLFHSSPLLRGFREIDSQVTNSELKKTLSGQRYKIGEFTTADYRSCYGLLPADSESGFIINAHRSTKGPYRLVQGAESSTDVVGSGSSTTSTSSKRKQMAQIWERIKEKLLYLGILILITGMLTLISYYHWSDGDIHHGFEHFMDSGGFGVRFMMTALGVVLKLFWSNLDQQLRRVAPYSRLALSSARPIDSILLSTYMSPFSAILPSLRQKHFVIALIAFLSILSEFLPICLANITFSATTTQAAYETCNGISMVILMLMLISIIFLFFSPRKGLKRLPRNPNTVASVLVYLAAQGGFSEREGLLDSVKGMEKMETEERNEVIAGWGRTYSLGLDKRDELRVDEDGRIERLWMDWIVLK